MLEEQQAVSTLVENLSQEKQNSAESEDENRTLEFLDKLLLYSGCISQICFRLQTIIENAIDKWENEIENFTNATYDALMTRNSIG